MERLSGSKSKQEQLRTSSESPNDRLEISDGFTKNAKFQTAKRILEQVRNDVPRWLLEKPLYLYLTQRVSDVELHAIETSFGEDGKKKYYANLRRVAQEASNNGLMVNNDVAWFSLYSNNPSARKTEQMTRVSDGLKVSTTYKEYFTVPIKSSDAQSALLEIEGFQNALPAIAKDLADLSQSKDDQIKLKIPGNLQSFIKHPDSLVIHYRNPALSGQIREIVARHLEAVGLETMRENRTESGFDFDSKNELYSGSHSSLMASVAAHRLMETIKENPILANASPERLCAFLDKAFGDYAAFSPKELLARLDKIKN